MSTNHTCPNKPPPCRVHTGKPACANRSPTCAFIAHEHHPRSDQRSTAGKMGGSGVAQISPVYGVTALAPKKPGHVKQGWTAGAPCANNEPCEPEGAFAAAMS
jgi:hypothetical protein